MLIKILDLIKIYEEEGNKYYDEYSHGDSMARQETYKRVVNDLKQIIANYE